jgi:hypothetical protein
MNHIGVTNFYSTSSSFAFCVYACLRMRACEKWGREWLSVLFPATDLVENIQRRYKSKCVLGVAHGIAVEDCSCLV